MFIDHHYKFIFIKTFKVGGTSFYRALQEIRSRNGVYNSVHDSASKIKKTFPQCWDEYTKISIVRNPWDSVNSWYHFDIVRATNQQNANYRKARAKFNIPDGQEIWKNIDEYFKYQGTIISSLNWNAITINNKIVVDNILRYETLNEDASNLSKLLNLPEDLGILLNKFNERSHGRRQKNIQRMSNQTLQSISRLYAKDIEYFNYSIPEIYK